MTGASSSGGPGGQGGFLGRLSAEGRDQLRARMQLRSYPDGAVILAADDPSRNLYVICAGRVVVSLYSADGKVVTYREAQPGDIFGELSALDGRPRSAFVTARGKVEVGVVSAEDFERLLAAAPDFARQLMLHLADVIRRMTERLFEMQTLLLRERLLRELVRRAREIDPEADRVTLTGLPTHFELASYIGTHREAVTKELGHLARRGLVRKHPGGLDVLSVGALEEAMSEHLD